jgi:hypothetical protein
MKKYIFNKPIHKIFKIHMINEHLKNRYTMINFEIVNSILEEILKQLQLISAKKEHIDLFNIETEIGKKASILKAQLLEHSSADIPYELCDGINVFLEKIIPFCREAKIRLLLRETGIPKSIHEVLTALKDIMQHVPEVAEWLTTPAIQDSSIQQFREAAATWDIQHLPPDSATFTAAERYYDLLQQKASQARFAATAEITACEELGRVLQQQLEKKKIADSPLQIELLQAFQRMYLLNTAAGLAEAAARSAEVTLEEWAHALIATP